VILNAILKNNLNSQGDIELLQFFNKPDTAYDMCSTIAPDCVGISSETTPSAIANDNSYYETVKETESSVNTYTEGPNLNTLTDNENDRRYDHRRRFFHEINSSDNPWNNVGRETTTENSIWSLPNFIGVTGQYPALTDPGKQNHF
jgi:hypothetical protein